MILKKVRKNAQVLLYLKVSKRKLLKKGRIVKVLINFKGNLARKCCNHRKQAKSILVNRVSILLTIYKKD